MAYYIIFHNYYLIALYYSYHSYKISYLKAYLEQFLKLHQIFGSEQFLFLLKILMDLLHLDYLYINLLIFHMLLLPFAQQLSLLVSLQLHHLYMLNMLHQMVHLLQIVDIYLHHVVWECKLSKYKII